MNQDEMGEKRISIETFEHHGKRNSKTSRASFYMNNGIDILPAKKKRGGGGDIANGTEQMKIEREPKTS